MDILLCGNSHYQPESSLVKTERKQQWSIWRVYSRDDQIWSSDPNPALVFFSPRKLTVQLVLLFDQTLFTPESQVEGGWKTSSSWTLWTVIC